MSIVGLTQAHTNYVLISLLAYQALAVFHQTGQNIPDQLFLTVQSYPYYAYVKEKCFA